MFKVSLALLEHSQEKLLQLDMEEMLKVRNPLFYFCTYTGDVMLCVSINSTSRRR